MYLFVSYEIITTFAPQNFLLINIKQRFMNNYETVFILTPVLSDAQMKEAVEKFTNLLKEQGSTSWLNSRQILVLSLRWS